MAIVYTAPQLQAAVKKTFFLYALSERASFLPLLQQSAIKKAALEEIVAISLMLNNETDHPYYGKALADVSQRLRDLPEQHTLKTAEGLRAYSDYLLTTFHATSEQLRAAYAKHLKRNRESNEHE
ncbi:hypothetical protein C4573_06795 [Candidatus Woesearchaeota archaeon]|nr:MAG: hypothetical protein C4573_06795 [Candidatus Woesearchaeota archaeon]